MDRVPGAPLEAAAEAAARGEASAGINTTEHAIDADDVDAAASADDDDAPMRRDERAAGVRHLRVCGLWQYGRRGHAKRHYEESLHAYALEMDTQQVWDFAGDGHVHRLIVNKGEEPRAVSPSQRRRRRRAAWKRGRRRRRGSGPRQRQRRKRGLGRRRGRRAPGQKRGTGRGGARGVFDGSGGGGGGGERGGGSSSSGMQATPSPKLVEMSNPGARCG